MAIEVKSTVKVQIPFTVIEGNDTFSDALYMTMDEYAAMTAEQITAVQHERYQNWKEHIAAQSAIG